jgi:adenine C2-methylase RlmN of 23S rRNA A2503 and tRNA A37
MTRVASDRWATPPVSEIARHAVIERVERHPFGRGYRLRTTQGHAPVFMADGILSDRHEGNVRRRKVGVSLSSGCAVGCRFCFTNRIRSYRPLTLEEITAQVHLALINSDWLNHPYQQLKFSFKQMGDPLVNPIPTLEALWQLQVRYHPEMLVVSTAGPDRNRWFFERLAELGDTDSEIRLQFSCHTSRDAERCGLCPKMKMLTFRDLGQIARAWPHGRVTLNFVVMKGMTYEVDEIARNFRPEDVFIKVNYIDRNRDTIAQKLVTDSETVVARFERDLAEHGFVSARRHTPDNYD